MKCQNLFSEKNKISSFCHLLLAQRVIKVKYTCINFFLILVWFPWNFHQNVGFYVWSWNKADGSLKRTENQQDRASPTHLHRASWSTLLESFCLLLRGIHFDGWQLYNHGYSPFWKVFYYKRQFFALLEKCFPFCNTHLFQKGLDVQVSNSLPSMFSPIKVLLTLAMLNKLRCHAHF